jgi:hypothetical protein
MTVDQQFKDRTATAAALDFLRDRLLSIVGLLLLGAGAAIFFGVEPQVPRTARLVGFTAAAFIPVGWMTGNWILGILYQPNWKYVVDLDAGQIDGALHRLPPEDFRELTVTDERGNEQGPYQITQLTSQLYCAKRVDLETLTCVGTWRGTLDDRELARSLRAVRECRGQLQDDAQKGFVLETSAFTIVRRAAREAALDVTQMFESGTLPDGGESISTAVDSALDDFGFEDVVDDLDDGLGDDLPDGPDDDHADDLDDLETTNGSEPTPEAADD